MIGGLLYLSTIFLFNPLLCLLVIPFIVFRAQRVRDRLKLKPNELLSLFFIIISVSLALLHFLLFPPKIELFSSSILGAFPYVFLLLISLLFSKFVTERDMSIILFFIAIEIIIGVFEYSSGVNSFFVSSKGETAFGTTELLYYNRVFGLSDNSSVFAFKILFFATYFLSPLAYNIKKNVRYICYILIFVGLFITFNRTTIISLLIYLIIAHLKDVRVLILIGISSLLFVYFYYEMIIIQLFRGSSEVDLSGRGEIFPFYLEFIKSNLLFGNSGAKVWVELNGSIYHAHNSYLEFLASNGIIVSMFFFIGLAMLFFGSWLYALPLLIYSTFQYGILWGFTFNDFILFSLLFLINNKIKPAAKAAVF